MDDKTANDPVEEKIEEPNIETPQEGADNTPPADTATEKEEKDRTSEQFEKLKESNQELKKERDEYKSLFDSLRPVEIPEESKNTYKEPINAAPPAEQFKNLNQDTVNEAFQSMVDADGYLDGNKLMSYLKELDQQSKDAQNRTQQLEQERKQEKQQQREQEEKRAQDEIYSKYPGLNPKGEDFDEKFWGYVYNELAVKAKRGELPSGVDYMQAADKVYKDLYEGRDMTKDEKQKQDEAEAAKRQINASRPRSPMQTGYYEKEEEQELVNKVRQGKKGAVAEMLRRRGQ